MWIALRLLVGCSAATLWLDEPDETGRPDSADTVGGGDTVDSIDTVGSADTVDPVDTVDTVDTGGCVPEAEIPYDGIDQDCDGADLVDVDGDGATFDQDCDDTNPSVYVGGVDRCGDGLDGDCDGTVDDACTECAIIYPGEAPSLQAAIDSAADGDVICVAPGTYDVNVSVRTDGITLLGVEGAGRTILQPADYAPVVEFEGGVGDTARLEGFTLQNGDAHEGGAILVTGASPDLVDLVIADNYAEYGAGVAVDGGAPTLTGVRVRENWSCWGYYKCAGGGLYISDADVTLDNVEITDNFSTMDGGGVYIRGGSLTLRNSRVTGNAVDYFEGGGISVYTASASFTNVLIADNVGSRGGGGAMYAAEATIEMENVVVTRNQDYDEGAAFEVYNSFLSFRNVVVSENTADDSDAAAIEVTSTDATFLYTDLWANEPTSLLGLDDPTGVDGNLAVDPLFLDELAHLDADSPLVDAGDPALLDPDGSRSDIGIFGGPGAASWDIDHDGWTAWWAPGPYDPASLLDCDDDDATVYPGAGC